MMSYNERLYKWLGDQGHGGALNDRLFSFLTGQSLEGAIDDMFRAYLVGQGYEGSYTKQKHSWGEDRGLFGTPTLPVGDYNVSSDAEFAAAIIAHNGASDGPERTLVLANGDYDLSAVNFTGRTWDNKPLKILGQSLTGVRFVGAGANLNNSSHITFDTFSMFRSKDYIENTGNEAFFLGSGSTHDITWTNCYIQGETFTEAELNDSVTSYASGMPMPSLFDLSASGQRIVVDGLICHTVRTIGTFPQTDGTRIRNITANVLYFDGIRMAANTNSADGDLWIVEDVTINRFVGKHNENTGGSAPHNDFTQTYNRGGSSITGGGVGIYRRIVANQSEGRGSLSQFGLVEGTNHTAIIFDACVGVIDSVHGVSIEQGNAPMQALAINCTFAGRGDSASPQFRDTSAQGFMTAVDCIFTGPFQRNGTNAVPSHHENRGSVFNFDPADFEGGLNPETITSVRTNLVASVGSSGEGKGGVRSGGTLVNASNIPLPAIAPTLTPVTGGFEATRAVPSELSGATVASYDLIYKDSSHNYTLVEGISASAHSVTVADGDYTVWTRPITTDGYPGLWSASGTVTVSSVTNLIGAPVAVERTSIADQGGGVYRVTVTGNGNARLAYAIDTGTHGTALNVDGYVDLVSSPASDTIIVRDSATNNGSGDNLASAASGTVAARVIDITSPSDVDFTANGASTSYLQILVVGAVQTMTFDVSFQVTTQ